jgi:DNA transposition AAA+ family ATPase
MLNEAQKHVILEHVEREITLRNNAKGKGGAEKFSVFAGISASQISRARKGELNVISEAAWITIARKLNIELRPGAKWEVAKTPTFIYITSQLSDCQNDSSKAIFCDEAGIGKTFTAKQYVRDHKNVAYIDCSQVKTKQRLVRQIAMELSIGSKGRYTDVYDDLVYALKTIERPLIILDEAGDLDYNAFLELKALENATSNYVGWYMMGADGLKVKIERHLNSKKVGYAEIFDRFGSRYQTVKPKGEGFKELQVALVGLANGFKDEKALIKLSQSSLRRVYVEIQKMRNHA